MGTVQLGVGASQAFSTEVAIIFLAIQGRRALGVTGAGIYSIHWNGLIMIA